MQNFTAGDIASLVVMGLMAIKVSFVGFSYELSSKAGIFVGLLASLMFSSTLSSFIDSRYSLGNTSVLISLVLLFLVGYVSTKILLSSLTAVFEFMHLTVLDHILGFGLGAIEGAIIVSALVYVLKIQTLIDISQIVDLSMIIKYLEPIAPISIDAVIQEVTLP